MEKGIARFLHSGTPALNVLVSSPYEYLLTGSRYFGGATGASDWDFIGEYSIEHRNFLRRNHFCAMSTRYYGMTNNCISVYNGVGVHVILVKDLVLSELVHKTIMTHYPHFSSFPKETRKEVYKLVEQAILKGLHSA